MRDRAYRRFQKQKLLAKWTQIGHMWHIGQEFQFPFKSRLDHLKTWVHKTAENMPICSNPFCCGNPRRAGQKTLQERRSDITQQEQCAAIGEIG